MLKTLNAQNRFAIAFRGTRNMKTEAGRKKKIADIVAMLKRGETIHPQRKRSSDRADRAEARASHHIVRHPLTTYVVLPTCKATCSLCHTPAESVEFRCRGDLPRHPSSAIGPG